MDHKGNDAPLRKLASAEDLRGKKSGDHKDGHGKKRKLWLSLIGLVVVLAIAVGAYEAAQYFKPAATDEEEQTYESTTVKLIDHDRSEVVSIAVALPDGDSYTVLNNNTYDEDGAETAPADGSPAYSIEGAESFDLDQAAAKTLLGYAANLTATKLVAENVTDLAPYGLDKPQATVTMTYRDGTKNVWLIGAQAPTSTSSYFCEQGSKAVFLIYQSAAQNMAQALTALHTCEMPWSIADTTTITDLIIEPADGETIEINYDDNTDTNLSVSSIRLVQPFVYGANSDRVEEMFNGVAALTIDAYAGELGELTDTGLENGTYRYKVTVQVTPDSTKPEETVTYTYLVGNFASADAVYVKPDNSTAVYTVDSSSLSFLDNATPGYLVDQFSNLIYIARVDALTIKTADDEWNVTIERTPQLDEDGKETGKEDEAFYFDGEPTDDTLFRKLYQEIIGTTNSKLCDDYHFDGKVYCTVTYKLNVEPNELTIEYLEYDDDYLAVRRDGLTLFLIKRDRVDSMINSLNEYRAGTFVAK